MKIINKHKHHQQGQVLLISIMLLAVVMTVIFSASFTNVTETKVTKLEEESQRALAAAEAAVEAMIAQSIDFSCSDCSFANVGIGSTALTALSGLSGIDTEKSQVYFDKTQVDKYIVPTILQNGEQYTLYLADPPDFDTHAISDFIVYWGSMTGSSPALEITIVNKDVDRPVSRYLVDPAALITKDNTIAPNYEFIITTTNSIPAGYLVEGDVATGEKEKVRFRYQTTVHLDANSQDVAASVVRQYAFVRVLFANSRLAFEKTGLPAQGKTAVADVVTNAGVNKAVKFFRTYQQLPAEFFITTF